MSDNQQSCRLYMDSHHHRLHRHFNRCPQSISQPAFDLCRHRHHIQRLRLAMMPPFPQDIDRVHPQSPLFRDGDSVAAQRAASEHHPDTIAFSLNFPFDLDITTRKQAWDYWKGCCDDANRLRRCHLPMPLSSISAHRDPISVRQLQSIERSHARAAARSAATRSHRPAKPVLSPPEHLRERKPVTTTIRHAPRPKQQHHHHASPVMHSMSPSSATSPPHSPDDRGSAKHRRAPASKPRPIGENWADVPDFCPPLSSLTTAPRPLRARPVGSSGPLDLSRDPDRDQLHPDELAVASTLRLQCAKYLLNKRKIFKAKVEHLQGSAGHGPTSTRRKRKRHAQSTSTRHRRCMPLSKKPVGSDENGLRSTYRR